MEHEANQPGKKEKKKELLSWVLCIVVALAIAIFLRLFIFELVVVKGPSMTPTLLDGQTVFVEKVSKVFSGYQRGDVVIVHYPDRTGAFIKRIVGLPGDHLSVQDGYLYRNGVKIDEPYTNDLQMDYDMEETIVPENHVFVMGDNRNNSSDSRSSSVGPIESGEIVGHALFVLFPVSEIKGIPTPVYENEIQP